MINPLRFNTIKSINHNKTNSAQNKPNIAFCARPEYEKIDRDNLDARASYFFRRGAYYEREKFQDVIDAIKLLLSGKEPPKILIAGLGRAQEPLSYLAVIKDLSENKPLESLVDLHCVDLQPKISNTDLDNYAYLDTPKAPMFTKESFEYIKNGSGKAHHHYKIKSDILEYLKEVFNNPQKTKWDTKIEEFSAKCPKKSYDMISINNVLMYIDDFKVRTNTIKNISKMLKQGGILITDMSMQHLRGFKSIKPGILKKMV